MKGKLIVIEGLDGSGKATQAELLTTFLKDSSQDVIKVSFPDYDNPSSTLVKMYLNGEVGTLDEVNSFAASSFYSLDRYISFQTLWKKHYENGGLVVADRYTTSNISHQMAKLPSEKWKEYVEWLTTFEYGLLELPAPDLVIYLDMHPKASEMLLSKRYNGDEGKKDLHEKNYAYMLQCRDAALFAAQKLGWKTVQCSNDDFQVLSVEEISNRIINIVKTL